MQLAVSAWLNQPSSPIATGPWAAHVSQPPTASAVCWRCWPWLQQHKLVVRLTYERHQRDVPDLSTIRSERSASPDPGGSTLITSAPKYPSTAAGHDRTPVSHTAPLDGGSHVHARAIRYAACSTLAESLLVEACLFAFKTQHSSHLRRKSCLPPPGQDPAPAACSTYMICW